MAVPIVGLGAGALSTSSRAIPVHATALAVHGSLGTDITAGCGSGRSRGSGSGGSTARLSGRILSNGGGDVALGAGGAVGPDGRAGHDIGSRVAGPLVIGDTRVGGLVHAGDLDEGTGDAATGALDLELGTLHVELRLADVALVDGNVLDAHEVLAGRDGLRHRELDAVLLPRAPAGVLVGLAAVAEARLHHLEPVAVAVVAAHGAGGLGHVDEAGARMLDVLVEPELEADLVARLDGVGLGGAGLGALVAAQIGGVDDLAGERGLVRVAVLADVGEVLALGRAVDDQLAENVVGLSDEGSSCEEQAAQSSSGLHGGGLVSIGAGDAELILKVGSYMFMP